MTPATPYQQLLQHKGVSLQRYGIDDIALSREDALLAVTLLRHASLPILGGDVYFKTDTEIEQAYANWHSEPAGSEDHNSFVIRSCTEAVTYIERFPSTNHMALFAFTVDL